MIVSVMFTAIKFGDITRSQMVSAVKKLKVKCYTSSKDEMAVPLAGAFVEQNFVKLNTKDLANVDRGSVEKLKIF